MERFLLVTVIVCCCFLRQSTGLEFTLDRDVGQDPDGLVVCGVLLCVEESHTDTNISTITDQGNTSISTSPEDLSTISSLTIYRTDRPSYGGTVAHTERTLIAAMHCQHDSVTEVFDDIRVTGHLDQGRATLQLKLVKQEDCQAEFTCQVRGVDHLGREVVSTAHLLYQPPEIRYEGYGDGWTQAQAQQLLDLVIQMDKNLSLMNQSVEDGMKRLEEDLDSAEDRIKTLDEKMEDVDDTVSTLNNSLTVAINSMEMNFDRKTEFLKDVTPGTTNYRFAKLLHTFSLKVSEVNNILSNTQNSLSDTYDQCLIAVKNESSKLLELEKRIVMQNEDNIQTSFKNFSRDWSHQVDTDLDSLKGSLERDIQEVYVIVNHTAANIDILLNRDDCDDTSSTPDVPVINTCKKGIVLNQTSSPDAVVNPDEDDVLKSPYLCDTRTDGGGWIIIQRRHKGDVDFYQDWATYKNGFGSLDGDFWLGNDNITKITSSGTYELRVDLRYNGTSEFAHYSTFSVGDEQTNYVLDVGLYDGTAGDALVHHHGMEFTTYDRDNDAYSTINCAKTYRAGWWYNKCFHTNLNGEWRSGTSATLSWAPSAGSYILSYVEMKIRRVPPPPRTTPLPLPPKCEKGMASSLPLNALQYSVFISNGEYGIKSPFLCDTMTDGGGWIVIQRRINGNQGFYRDWAAYKKGFGALGDNFWLGNDNIHNIASTGTYELRVELEYEGKPGMAHYNHFYLGGESTNYTLHVGEFSGTIRDSLSYHNGMQFSTYDVDNDLADSNFAELYSGAWWFGSWFLSDLNGIWGATGLRGLRWSGFTGQGSANYTEMKIRRQD